MGVQSSSTEQLKRVDLELLFQNVNLETSLYYKLTFEEGSSSSANNGGGVIKSVERLPFLPLLFDSTAAYFNDSIPLWIIKIIFLLFLFYNGVQVIFAVENSLTPEIA